MIIFGFNDLIYYQQGNNACVYLLLQVFWSGCILLMLSLGVYWSIYLYLDWQEKPVLTTVTTTALPVSQVDFPALTICSEGELKLYKNSKYSEVFGSTTTYSCKIKNYCFFNF